MGSGLDERFAGVCFPPILLPLPVCGTRWSSLPQILLPATPGPSTGWCLPGCWEGQTQFKSFRNPSSSTFYRILCLSVRWGHRANTCKYCSRNPRHIPCVPSNGSGSVTRDSGVCRSVETVGSVATSWEGKAMGVCWLGKQDHQRLRGTEDLGTVGSSKRP